MEPNQMGAAGQPEVGPMPEPTPQPTMPETPVQETPIQPTEQPVQEPAMTMEAQMAAAMNPEPVQPIANQYIAPAEAPKKKGVAGILAIILVAVIIIGGGVLGYMLISQKDEEIASYTAKIAEIQKENNELKEKLGESELLSSDEALDLLREGVTKNQLQYTILNANLYAEYTGEEDQVAYWVKYVASDATGVIAQYNTIFKQNEDGTWSFEIPGFTNPATITASDYTVIE